MGGRESIWTHTLALCASAPVTLPTVCAGALLRTPADSYSSQDPARVARALDAARGGGAAIGSLALDGFAAAGVSERRARARIVRHECGPDDAPRVLSLTADPDAAVRTEIARALARLDWAGAREPERRAALLLLADTDPDADVRATARTGLAALAASAELGRLADHGPAAERAAARIALAAIPEARADAQKRLAGAAGNDGEFALSARLAAEGGAGPAEDAFLARVDAALARGGGAADLGAAALERWAARLVQLGAESRGVAALTPAAEAPARVHGAAAHELRARLALTRDVDARAAEDAARALGSAAAAGETGDEAAVRAARAARLGSAARLALGTGGPDAALERARADLTSRLARRAGRDGAESVAEEVALFEELAQVELSVAVRDLAATPQPDPRAAVGAAYALVHATLRAQAAGTRAEVDVADGLDRLLGADDSAVSLAADGEAFGALDPARQIAIRLALGRALRTAAGAEMVGFEPLEGFDDDPRAERTRALLEEVLRAELERAQTRHARASMAVERARSERPGGAPAALVEDELAARIALQRAWEDASSVAGGDAQPLADQRSASWFAVTTARRLRDAGRGADARALLARARTDLEAGGAAQRWLWGIELLAEIEAATGASFTDDEEPAQAEVQLLRAVDRLKALEDLLRERGAPGRAIDAVKYQRANALVSLAVNANVRMGQPDRALKHFEAAWALRQDEFLRVLLACYRARSGRAAEARAALATVAPGPGTYYNLACAWALLGERDVALRWLEKELRENHAPGGGLERQQAWARKDPDLASLRDDPRFVELTAE